MQGTFSSPQQAEVNMQHLASMWSRVAPPANASVNAVEMLRYKNYLFSFLLFSFELLQLLQP